jgi:hypothetical protein
MSDPSTSNGYYWAEILQRVDDAPEIVEIIGAPSAPIVLTMGEDQPLTLDQIKIIKQVAH